VTVITALFQNSLHQANEDPIVTLDHIFGVEPIKITSPPTDSEIALALRVLEGCCLLYSRCTALAHKYNAVKVSATHMFLILPLLALVFLNAVNDFSLCRYS
jgi:hypothetical protein